MHRHDPYRARRFEPSRGDVIGAAMTALRKWDEPRPVRLRVEDFLRLNESDALQALPKVELIEGVIVAMKSQWAQHARVKTRLTLVLAAEVVRVMPGFEVLSEVGVAIPPENVPEPDIAVTSFQGGREAVPVETVALVVEVADTTLRYDLDRKMRIYAQGGVPEYWVVDVEGRVIHQMWAPARDTYAERREVAFGEVLEAAAFAGLKVETEGLS